MKKTIIAVILCFVVMAVGLIPVFMGGNLLLTKDRYTADLAKFSTESADAGTFTAEIGGRTYAVTAAALDGINRRLNYAPDLRQTIEAAPQDSTDTLVLRMGSECTVTLYALDADGNDTAVMMDCQGRRYDYRLDDFKVFAWVKQDVLDAVGDAAEDAALNG